MVADCAAQIANPELSEVRAVELEGLLAVLAFGPERLRDVEHRTLARAGKVHVVLNEQTLLEFKEPPKLLGESLKYHRGSAKHSIW